MLGHGLFGILLHARVDGSVYLQSVGIEVVLLAVLLGVLLAPAVEGVVLPVERVFVVLLHLPAAIFGLDGLLGRQHRTQVFAEVGRRSFLVVHAVVLQLQGQCLQGVALSLGQVARLAHLVEHHVAASAGTLSAAHGVEERRVLAHAHQRGGFFDLEVLGVASEVGVGSSLHAHGIVQEVELVEVHRQDLFLRVVAFQFDGDDPLDGFLEETLQRVLRAGRIELLGQLLGDGTAAAGVLLEEEAALHHGTEQGLDVDARMLGKAYVFRGDEGVDDVGRQVLITHVDAVFLAVRIGAQRLSVGRKDLCGKLVVRVLQVFDGRHVAYPAFRDGGEHQHACQQHDGQQYPEGYDDFLYHVQRFVFTLI